MTRLRSAALLVVALLVTGCSDGTASATPGTATGVPTASAPAVSGSPSAAPSGSIVSPAPSASVGTATGEPPRLALEPVVGGLDRPLDVATRPGDASSFLVAEQGGRIRVVRDGRLVERPFLDLSDRATAGGEQGLLGVAVHPDPADGRLFVYYTDRDEDQVVASYPTDPADPDHGLADRETRVLVMDDPFGNHNGGGLQFGPDGFLYIATGDGGGGGDPLGSGRDLGSLLAKILRIDVDTPSDSAAYGIPADNPFVGHEGARPEVWLTGLRNPFRIRFDSGSGALWIGDVGQGSREEIDVAPAGVGGLDYGWNLMEGTSCYAEDPCDPTGLTLPVAEYAHDQGCSVAGGAVYRGTAQPTLTGWYVFADYCSGLVWVLPADPAVRGDPVEATLALESGRPITAIAPGPDGELLATDLRGGEVLRVVVAD